jgi:hypothetical protein
MEPQSPPDPAIPHKQLLPSLQQVYFNKWMLKAFQRESDLAELQFGLHQVYFIYDFAQRKTDHQLSVNSQTHSDIAQPTSKQCWPTARGAKNLRSSIGP